MNLFVLNIFSVANISVNLNSIPILDGSYFKDRKYIYIYIFVLSCKDLDLALQIKCPTTPTYSSSSVDIVNYEKWER